MNRHSPIKPAPALADHATTRKRLKGFERYLSLWVVLGMAAGVLLGIAIPSLTSELRAWQFGGGSLHAHASVVPSGDDLGDAMNVPSGDC